jgi:putative transposase
LGCRRVLIVVDIFSKFPPVIDPCSNYYADHVVMTLENVCGEVGYPKTIRVNQGSEFVLRDVDLWAYAHNVTLDFSRPGKPTDNAFIEAFNSKVRSECLNAHWFMSLDDSRSKLEDWQSNGNVQSIWLDLVL